MSCRQHKNIWYGSWHKVDIQKLVIIIRASLVAQLVKDLPATPETLVQFLDGEDPLEKG